MRIIEGKMKVDGTRGERIGACGVVDWRNGKGRYGKGNKSGRNGDVGRERKKRDRNTGGKGLAEIGNLNVQSIELDYTAGI